MDTTTRAASPLRYYRRMCARMDKAKAVTAAAHKLARLIYLMLTKGQEYTDKGQLYSSTTKNATASASYEASTRRPSSSACTSCLAQIQPEYTFANQSLGACFLKASIAVELVVGDFR